MNIVFVTTSRKKGEAWIRKKLDEFRALFEPHMQTGEWLARSCAGEIVLHNGDCYRYCTKELHACGLSIDKLYIDEGVDPDIVKEFKFHCINGYIGWKINKDGEPEIEL